MKGLFNKVKNRYTHQRYVVSTIRKGEELFETAVFAASFWYIPKSLKKAEMMVHTQTQDEAWDLHYEITARLAEEYPTRLFQEFTSQ
jgi:hypothetical protein